MTPSATRVHVLLARQAPVGLVIRRGPREHGHLLVWDTRTDSITPGQWLKARLYPLRCDLSPDGTKLVYFALDGYFHGPSGGAYTAVSRPPYFTALAMWPKGNAWHGGGLFLNNRTLWLNGAHRAPLLAPPSQLRVTPTSTYPADGNAEDLGVYFPRLARDGWVDQGHEDSPDATVRTWAKARRRLRLHKRTFASISDHVKKGRGVYFDEHELFDELAGATHPLPGAEWADFDQQGRLVYAADGELRTGEIVGGRFVGRVIADLRGLAFKAIPPPASARRW